MTQTGFNTGGSTVLLPKMELGNSLTGGQSRSIPLALATRARHSNLVRTSQAMVKLAFLLITCLVLGLGSGVRAESVVVLDSEGKLLDLDSDYVKKLVKEKARIQGIMRQSKDEDWPPQARMEAIYQPVVKANLNQFERNARNAEKFKSMATQAAGRNQEETAKKYMLVAKLFFEYAKKNREMVSAFQRGSTADMRVACESIFEIEKQIRQISRKQVPREWVSPQEVQGIRIMSEKAYRKWQEERAEEAGKERPVEE